MSVQRPTDSVTHWHKVQTSWLLYALVRLLLALVLFASGAAALIYQVLWIKQLSLVVGVEVYAVTTAVSAFFAGLALGCTLFGRWGDRLVRPCQLYALLELGIAGLGAGICPPPEQFAKRWKLGRRFVPKMKPKEREEKYRGWKLAVAKLLAD